MPANIAASVAQAQLDNYTAQIDAGAGTSILEILTADYATVLVSYSLSATAFGAATLPTPPAPSIATANGLPIAGTGLATATAGAFRQKSGDGVMVAEGSGAGAVGTSAAIVILSDLSIELGQAVTLNGYQVSQPTELSIYTP